MKQIVISISLLFCFLQFSGQNLNSNISLFENNGLLSETFLNGGYCYKSEVIGDLMYVGCSAGLLIYDISDSTEYDLIGVHNSYNVSAFHFENNLVYLGANKDGKGRIEIIDIDDPTHPELIFCLDFPYYVSSSARNIIPKDDFIYVSYSHLYMIDMTDWEDPTIYQDWSIYAKDFEIKNNLLYELNVSQLFIHEIINDTSFILRSSIVGPGWNWNFCLEDNLVYIPGNSLMIIDVSDPDNPVTLSNTFFSISYLADVDVSENKAYVTGKDNDEGVFAIVDVQKPDEPIIIYENYDYLGSSINVDENKVFISSHSYNGNGPSGLLIFDVTDPFNVSLQDFIIYSTAKKCKAYGDLAFIANGYSGFKIIDISNIYLPNILSSVTTKWEAVDVLVDADVLYVALADSGIQIYSIEDLSNPVLLGEHCTYNSWNGYMKLDIYQDYLYTAGLCGINDIIDVSDPKYPVLVGSIPTNDWGPDIQILNDHLFLAGYWGGFQIFSLENPVNPVEIGYFPLDLALNITVSNNLAFIYGYHEILIFYIGNLTNPSLISTIDPAYVYHMYAQGDTLYYSNGSPRINVLDVSNPYNPTTIDSLMDIRAISFDFAYDNIITHDDHYLRILGDTIKNLSERNLKLKENYLLKNFPNPCSQYTNFEIYFHQKNNATLEILNTNGQIVKSVFNSVLNKGNHSFTCNLEDIPPGLYFYKLTLNGKQIEIKKMLVIK